MAKIDANTLEIMANIIKSPADTVAIVKGSNGEISASTISGIAGMTSSLASIIATNPELKAGLSKLGLGASMVGLGNDIYDISFKNKTDDKTLTSLTSNVLAVAGGIVALGSSPAIAASLLVAGTGLAVWSAFETGNDISDSAIETWNDIGNQIKSIKESLGNQIDNVENFVEDITNAFSDITNTQQNKYEAWEDLSKEEQAEWIQAGGTPWNYNTNTLLDELNNKDLNIIDKIKELLKQASTISSPLVLDINKDGTINTTGKIVNFDLDNNGYAELTAWVNSEDGILVYDKNNNGIIDNGSELFGNNTTLSSGKLADNGFSALADYDLNKDGKIDSSDSIYSQLRVWQDLNQNGISEAEEMFTLSELNIDTINTAYTTSSTIDQYGNEHKQIGTFTSNGETYNINDVWFRVDKASTIDLNQVEISGEIVKLPDIKGFGNVSSLHQAMAKDSTGELQRVIEEFIETKNKALIDEIIFKWTNVYDVNIASRGTYLSDARILEAMENLTGEEFNHNGNKNPGANSSNIIINAYINFKDFVMRSLSKDYQSTYLSLIEIDKNTEGAIIAADVSKLISFIKVSYLIDTENTLNKISELMLTLKLNKEEFGVVNNAINSYIIDNPSGSYYLDEYLRGFSKDFTDMNLYAKDSFDISTFILGGSSNEDTYGSREDDTFVGSKGDDYSSGNYGKDTYLFKLGDGNDTILENSISSENDKIVFGKGIKKEDINIEINGKNLLLKYSDNDSITIKGWNDISSKRVEYFLFEDGSIESIYDETFFNTVINGSSSRDNIDGLNGDDIIYGNGGGDAIYAKKGDDYIVTKEGKDSIYGEEGNDTIYAGAGDDYIVGGEGNDLIYGEDGDDNIRGSSGDDIIIGGKGDDTLSGGNGSDTYIFSKGDGVDSISDDGTDTTEIDKILFTQEITKSDIVFNYNSSNIKISYSNEDLINITSFKSLSKKRVERMELADGSYLTYNDINNIIQQMNAYATTNDIDITNINNIRQDDGLMNIFENSWRQDQIA